MTALEYRKDTHNCTGLILEAETKEGILRQIEIFGLSDTCYWIVQDGDKKLKVKKTLDLIEEEEL